MNPIEKWIRGLVRDEVDQIVEDPDAVLREIFGARKLSELEGMERRDQYYPHYTPRHGEYTDRMQEWHDLDRTVPWDE